MIQVSVRHTRVLASLKRPRKEFHVTTSDEEQPKKRFRIQRKRLGKLVAVKEENSFGFIEAEDFRDDVFFHFQDWDGSIIKNGHNLTVAPEPLMWVEFELDDDHFETEKKLRAKVVRPTDRPIGRKLSGRDATFNIVNHHPKARRKRPDWRK